MSTEKMDSKLKYFKIESYGVALIIGIMALCFSIYLICMGYHSVDLAQNMLYLESEFGIHLNDLTNQGTEVNYEQIYQAGWWQLRVGILLMFSVSFFLGMIITDMMRLAKSGK